MKRPLAIICILLAIILAAACRMGESRMDSPPARALEYLSEAADTEGRITLQGTVAECNAVSEGIRLSMDHISIQTTNNYTNSLSSDLKITFTTEENLAPGDVLSVRGKIREYEPATNPGQFDARNWYFAQNVVCALRSPEILGISRGGMSLERGLYLIRSAVRKSYTAILGDKAARTVSAITLGEKSYLEQEWKKVYQEGGIAHILAISGLHITMIGMALYGALRKLGAGFGASAILGGSLVALYTVMAGGGVSAVRAAVMFALWLGSQVCGRKQDTVTAAAAAALALTVGDGDSLGQAAFLLSFGSVLSLGILVPRLKKIWGGKGLLSEGILAGSAVWLGTLPWTLYFYYQAPPWSILVNLAVIPLMSALMAVSLVAAALGMVCIPLGIFAAAPASYILELFEWLCALERKLPGSVLVLGRPAPWKIAVYYAVLGAAVFFPGDIRFNEIMAKGRKCVLCVLPGNQAESIPGALQQNPAEYRHRKKAESAPGTLWQNLAGPGKNRKNAAGKRPVLGKARKRAAWLLCAGLCMLLMGGGQPGKLRIVCMDVGQGDGCLIQFPTGENCLIDGGSSSKKYLWDNILSQTVKYYGVGMLDYIFLSHADRDHISGIAEFLEEYEPGFGGRNTHGVSVSALVLPPAADQEDFREIKALAKEKEIRILQMQGGGRIAREGKWQISCLAPETEHLTGDRNQDSMVLRLTYGSFSMLFTGDLELEAEQRLARLGTALRSDVLKAGHHGSANASSRELLLRVEAKFAVISCGKDNLYGHPSPDTVARLETAGCSILRTDRDGAVILETDGKTYGIDGFGAAECD